MPRGYGSGYRIQPRPIYGDNEPTWGETMGRGIGRFLEDRAKKKEQTDDFENQVRDQGGEVVAPPSTMDRLRGIGGMIRRHLPGYDPLPEAEANMAKNPIQIGTTPSGDAPPLSGGAHGHRGPVDQADGQYGIANEIERSIQHGPGGYEAILPTARGRQQMATRQQIAAEARARAGKREDFGYEKGIEHTNRMEEIKAGGNGLSPEEWDRRQEIRSQDQRQLKGTPTGNAPNVDLAEKRARATILNQTITRAQAVIPRNAMDRRMAMRDPAQKQRIEQAEHEEKAAREELRGLALPEYKDEPAPTESAAPGEPDKANAPREVVKQRADIVRADALKKFPKASKEAVTAYVRNVMKREGWPVE